MLNEIIEYFENNLMIGLIIIVALLFLLSKYNKEHFDSVGNSCNAKDKIFKSHYEGRSKLVNFSCKLNGKRYYLANMKSGLCESLSESFVDCAENILVLIPEDEIKEGYKKYSDEYETNKKLCNSQEKAKCQGKENAVCSEEYEACATKKQYIHDFEVVEFIESKPSGERKYTIRGVSSPKQFNINDSPVKLSKNMYYKSDVVCGDSASDAEDTKLMIAEKYRNDRGGIIGGLESFIWVNLYFETQVKINGTPIFDGSIPRMKKIYVSICDNIVCKYSGKEYPRICFTDNEIDKNIINFEPMIRE
uniref:Uncharacterized protein n=1 Tax=viral metagenome TaxID=1070528 RepID=A0A6C0E9J4_9ZZZZ